MPETHPCARCGNWHEFGTPCTGDIGNEWLRSAITVDDDSWVAAAVREGEREAAARRVEGERRFFYREALMRPRGRR